MANAAHKSANTTFRIGDLVQVEIAGASPFKEPVPIARIETAPDGSRWYFFEGSTSGAAPEHSLRAAEPKPSRDASVVTKLVRVPNNLLGMVLDHGRASAVAARLLAIKLHQFDFPGGALNEGYCRRVYGIRRPSFHAGIRLLKNTKVLERTQPNHRTYAVEAVVDPGRNFVLIDEKVLHQPSALVAFTLAVNLSPDPLRPAEAARRIGIGLSGKARGAIRKLTKTAIEQGLVASTTTSRGAILLARRGHNFDLVEKLPAKNVLAKNVPTQRDMEDSHSDKKKRTQGHATRSRERTALALVAIAFALCRAVAQGRRIRSIAFVVQRLEGQTLRGDLAWAYDYPSTLPQHQLDEAATIATALVGELEADGFPLIRRELLGTDGIEAVAARIKLYGLGAVMVGVRDCMPSKRRPDEGRRVIGWSWFDDLIRGATRPSAAKKRRRAA